jgi:electron transfer flavoprotein beta subunit
LKIGVCVKQVPDTETKIRINDSRNWISEEGVKFVINPYDEYALEEALKAKEKFGGEVAIITVGPKRCQESIRSGLAMGADRAIHIVCDDYRLSSLTVAKILKEVISKEKFDLVMMGKQAVDNDFSSVGPMLSELLGWASGNVVIKLDFSQDGKVITAQREVEGGGKEVLELLLPTLITATKGLNNPRYPSLKGIMQAKKKEIKEVSFSDLGLSGDKLTDCFTLENFRLPPERTAGKIIDGEPADAAEKLAELLRNEAKVI